MAKSSVTLQITDNTIVNGSRFKVEVLPTGNIGKWLSIFFYNSLPASYNECQVGADIEETIDNLKIVIDSYYIGNGQPSTSYSVTKTATDTLFIEIIYDYFKLESFGDDGLENNSIITVNNVDNLKYEIDYLDIVNISHRFELYDDNYYEAPIEINGTVILDYGEVNENLEAVRGQGLRVSLDADVDLTFEELFTENEKTFKTIYYRNSVILFQGWLNPEGFYEDYVSDKWVVSFDCIDGLGYLKDLAFVNDNGTNITGVKTQLEILSLALRRTGILVDINVNIDVFYTGLSNNSPILEKVNINTRRYIKNDKGTNTIMDCEEVIRDVLEPYGAVLTSYNGQWVIYKPNQLVAIQTATFFRYDYLGVALSPTTVVFDFDFTIGSQLDGFNPHYCNGNQSFTNKPSIGASRISYKYGLLASLIENEDLFTADGLTYDDFTVLNTVDVIYPPAGGNGIGYLGAFGSYPPSNNFKFKSNDITFSLGAVVSVTVGVSGFGVDFTKNASGFFQVKLVGTSNTYYFSSVSGTWTTGNQNVLGFQAPVSPTDGLVVTSSFAFPVLPEEGDFSITFKTPFSSNMTSSYSVWLNNVSISIESESTGIEGEIFTFQRETNPSARIDKTKQVLTGDSNLDIYEGTLYKADGITPTSTWYRKGITEAEPILSIMGAETMRMNANTMRIFSGDIFGYFNYLSVVTIDGRVGKFGVTKYSYDTYNNIISATFKQMFADELTDLDIQKTLDYGTVVEPTIKG